MDTTLAVPDHIPFIGEVDTVIHCSECQRLWGVAFYGKEHPDPVVAFHAMQGIVGTYIEEERDRGHDVTRNELWDLKLPELVQIVYITEGQAAFISDKGFDFPAEPPCWFELEEARAMVPAWFLSRRKKRWALRMKCTCW